MPNFLQCVDARTSLAGANQLEVLFFSLRRDQSSDRDEVFAINVFKVREVMHAPEITRAPDKESTMEGMVSLRGVVVPVINLAKLCSISAALPPKILIVTEYNKNVQAFLVDAVECIERLAWDTRQGSSRADDIWPRWFSDGGHRTQGWTLDAAYRC